GAKGIRRRQLLPAAANRIWLTGNRAIPSTIGLSSALRHALIDRRIHLSSALHTTGLLLTTAHSATHALHVLLDHALDRRVLHEHLHDALHIASGSHCILGNCLRRTTSKWLELGRITRNGASPSTI